MLILNPFLAMQPSLAIVGSHKYRMEPFCKELWLCSLLWPDIVPRQSIPVTAAIKCQGNNVSRRKKKEQRKHLQLSEDVSQFICIWFLLCLFVTGAEGKNSKAFVKSNAIMNVSVFSLVIVFKLIPQLIE